MFKPLPAYGAIEAPFAVQLKLEICGVCGRRIGGGGCKNTVSADGEWVVAGAKVGKVRARTAK